MTTLEMEILVMKHFNFTQNIIVPGVSWGIKRWPDIGELHECDVLKLSKNGYATEIEIKVSKSDLLKDKDKPHGHASNFIKHLYFAVPQHLQEIALQEAPDRAGILVAKEVKQGFYQEKTRVFLNQIREPKTNLNAVKWTDEERYKLMRLGCMRIHTLKKNLLKLKK